jgi:hypothetical protein
MNNKKRIAGTATNAGSGSTSGKGNMMAVQVGRDEVPAKQGIKGTINGDLDKHIVPSIRRWLSSGRHFFLSD